MNKEEVGKIIADRLDEAIKGDLDFVFITHKNGKIDVAATKMNMVILLGMLAESNRLIGITQMSMDIANNSQFG